MRTSTDVAIVGAGVAGLAAARALARRGIACTILEASPRVGGRVRTLHHACGIVELGPEFVHGAPEATLALVRDAGLTLEPVREVHHVRRGKQLVSLGDTWAAFAKWTAGATTETRSAAQHLATLHLSPEDARQFTDLVEGFYGARLDDISMASIANDTSGPSQDGQQRLREGYGALVDRLANDCAAAGAAITTSCRVTAIAWRPDGATLAYRSHDELVARRVIVTIPIGLLQRGAIAFVPALPPHVVRALGAIGMGAVEKLVICLREPVWRNYAPADLAFVHGGSGGFPTFWVDGLHLTAWAGGPHATNLAARANDELIARAVTGFANAIDMPRAALAAAVSHCHRHDYLADPHARGAYSYTRVGGDRAAIELGVPLGDTTLLFAGEALDRDAEGTVGGALASGEAAAHTILGDLHHHLAHSRIAEQRI